MYKIEFEIDEDDDFMLDIGSKFFVTGETFAKMRSNAIKVLRGAKFTYVNGHHDASWYSIRDEAIRALKTGHTGFSWGGNQTIEYTVYSDCADPTCDYIIMVNLKHPEKSTRILAKQVGSYLLGRCITEYVALYQGAVVPLGNNAEVTAIQTNVDAHISGRRCAF